MRLEAWLNPITGLPPVFPQRPYTPTGPAPIFSQVFVAGTLSHDATVSDLELEGIAFSGIYPRPIKALTGGTLRIEFGPPLELADLCAGSSLSLSVDLIGWPQVPSVKGFARQVFFTRPAPC
jgi:hypothetical protein